MTRPVLFDQVRLLGYSPWPVERIVQEVWNGHEPSRIPGDFVAIAESRQPVRTMIVTSAMGAVPYFYHWHEDDRRLFHGAQVITVAKQIGHPWRWCRRALQALAFMDHTLFDDTLHADVKAMPQGAVLSVEDGRFSLRQDGFLAAIYRRPLTTAADALEAFDISQREMAVERPYVSLSSGYDSRTILAWFLACGVKPVAVTMGFPNTTDLVVSRAITQAFGLEHIIVEIQPDQYLQHGRAIARLTAGAKKASHWHTYIYSQALAMPAGAVDYVGNNGGLARGYYFDKGILSLVANAGLTDFTRGFWHLKMDLRRRRHAWLSDNGRLSCIDAPDSLLDDVVRASAGVSGFLNRLDYLMMSQRIPRFHGYGRALHLASGEVRSPFLDYRWTQQVARLRRLDRLGGQHYRQIIGHYCPRLLDFPQGANPPMGSRPRPLYWLRNRPDVGYSPFAQLVDRPDVLEMLRESSALDALIPRPERLAALAKRDFALIEFLLTLHFTAEMIREEAL